MFTLRQQHADAFQEMAITPSRKRIIATLKDSWPEEVATYGEEELNVICNQGINLAIRSNIEKERNVCFVVGAILMLGDSLHEGECLEWFSYVLNNEDFDEDMKGFFVLKGIIQFADKKEATDNAS